MALSFGDSVEKLRGIGPKTAKAMEKLGIRTLRDLMYHYPRGYEDRTALLPIAELSEEKPGTALVEITSRPEKIRLRNGNILVQAEACDDSGEVMLHFFHREYMASQLHEGQKYYIFGKISGGRFARDMINPEVRPAAEEFQGEILPIYALTEGVSQRDLRRGVRQVLEECLEGARDQLPAEVRMAEELCTVRFALKNIHFPDSPEACELARKRLIFGEFFTLSVALHRKKLHSVGEADFRVEKSAMEEFCAALPFSLTEAQNRVLKEISDDLLAGRVMNRLVQGDVGSGKTAVAAAACFAVLRAGRQAVVMAPTELLARQHQASFARFLAPFGLAPACLTGATPAAERKRILEGLREGTIPLLVGTHAVLEEKVEFRSLGITVCDEQHRFGVEQRATLAAKGKKVHTLVMSATPIPRTLALVLYGDLDVSVIDQLPPGRQKIATFLLGEEKREGLYGFLRKEIAAGHRAYIVCPLVAENEDSGQELRAELHAAVEYTRELSEKIFPDLQVALLHGKMKNKEKNAVMEAFSRGETQILVSTTVIEVGIDVPEATVMVVENAERFGLAQLHQLRGRVGRGKDKSYCFLLSSQTGETAERLRVLASTNDGFRVAQADLEQRGPGDFFGERQSGLPELKIASYSGDTRLLAAAQRAAEVLLATDPALEKEENRLLARAVENLAGRLERA